MKTLNKKSPFRYQKVLQTHESTGQMLMQLMQISPDEYYMREFEGGIALLDRYFNDSEPATRLKKLLATERKHAFWPHYRLGRRRCEVQFWNAYKPIYDQEGQHFSEAEQRSELYEEWKEEMRAYIELPTTHEELRQHILQSKIPI